MSKLRSVNTGFWNDEYVGDLSRDERYLFLYFLTNPLTNIAGAYKIGRKVIRQDTGFTDDELDPILEKLERDGKAVYQDGWIVLTNFLKNQSLNENMRKGVLAEIGESPAWVARKVITVIKASRTLSKGFKGLETLISEIEALSKASETFPKGSETFRKDEEEVEREEEEEPKAPPLAEIYAGTVLAGVKKNLGLQILPRTVEREFVIEADIARHNNFTAEEFIECHADAVKTSKATIRAEWVNERLPAFVKSKRPVIQQQSVEELIAERDRPVPLRPVPKLEAVQ